MTTIKVKQLDDDDTAARRARFLARSEALRRKTKGRRHTPAELLIRADRDDDHRGS